MGQPTSANNSSTTEFGPEVFRFIDSFQCGLPGMQSRPGASAARFDFRQELLWTGLHSGDVQSFAVPNCQPYTARQVYRAPVTAIHTDTRLGRGMLILSPSGLKLMSRRGLMLWGIDAVQNGNLSFLDCSFSTLGSTPKMLVSTVSGELLSVNIEHGAVSREVFGLSMPLSHLRPHGPHTVAAAQTNGTLVLLDTRIRATNPAATIPIHSGPFTDLCVLPDGNKITACGLNAGVPQLSVTDVRSLSKNTFYHVPSHLLNVLEDRPTCVLTATRTAIMLFDVVRSHTVASMPLVSPPFTLCTSLTGDYLALGDVDGFMHLFSIRNLNCNANSSLPSEMRGHAVNHFSDPVEVPSLVTPVNDLPWNLSLDLEFSEIAGLPHYSTPLLSGTWPSRLSHSAGLPSPFIDQAVLDSARQDGPVAFALRPTSLKNNQWPYRSHTPVARFKSTRMTSTTTATSVNSVGSIKNPCGICVSGAGNNILYSSCICDKNSPRKNNQKMPTSKSVPAVTGLVASAKYLTMSVSSSPSIIFTPTTEPPESRYLTEEKNHTPQHAATAPPIRSRVISNSGSEHEMIPLRQQKQQQRHQQSANYDPNSADDYRLMRIEYSRFGVLDFDFDYFNQTEHTGLETGLSSSYVNGYLQVLYYSRPLCLYAIEHSLSDCADEWCLLCESGFLFRMLQQSRGRACCRAANWLAVFSQLRETAALNLRENPRIPFHSISVTMQQCARFLLEGFNMSLLAGISTSKVMENYMLEANMTFLCPKCSAAESREAKVFTVDMVYPGPREANANVKFEELLRSSLLSLQQLRSWCAKCETYTAKSQSRSISKLPNCIQINSNAGAEWNSDWWITKEKRFLKHLSLPFLQPRVCIIKTTEGGIEVRIPENQETMQSEDIYVLTAVVCEVFNDKPHLVSHVQTKPGEWHLFNDFKVVPVPEFHVLQFPCWKVPSVIHYTREDMFIHGVMEDQFPTTPIAQQRRQYDVFAERQTLNLERHKRLKHPLKQVEVQQGAKMIFAIDCEFVSLQAEVADFTSEGVKQIVSPAQLSLARVSVMRGSGSKRGTVCFDDYIVPYRPIADYLTVYSGIVAEDLNPQTSGHHLVTLKTAYRKLRAMVDAKVRFVGHGLAQDFRILNLYVPAEQIVDTVDLYHISAMQRKLSLKFLAWSVLGVSIQRQNHDSIEDARTALALYTRYQEKRAHGDAQWEDLVAEIYRVGRTCGFKAPE